jgi:hypothetical protein
MPPVATTAAITMDTITTTMGMTTAIPMPATTMTTRPSLQLPCAAFPWQCKSNRMCMARIATMVTTMTTTTVISKPQTPCSIAA